MTQNVQRNTKMFKSFYRCLILAFAVLVLVLMPSVCLCAKDDASLPPKEWMNFLSSLKKEMLAKGISEGTIEKAYGTKTYYHVKPEVVIKDKKQAEFILTSQDYINKIVSESRVKKARQEYKALKKQYQKVSDEYQVPMEYLIAFWGIETNFGQNKGKYHLIDGLTNLSYRNRRAKFFKNELYHVLKIMDKFDLENDKMLGSWAGAMGHFQFMPSTYNAYAIDQDGDGVADIWDSFDDAIASAANYLHHLGWKPDEPWGKAVTLPWDFDYTLAGYQTRKSVEDWEKLGVKDASGNNLDLNPALMASIILPDGRKGQPYLILGNFRRIMIWNRSENYALAVSLLADYISSSEKYHPLSSKNRYALTNEDVLKVQKFINKILHLRLTEDGKLGPKTKNAIKKLQAKAKMHQDGYPDYGLLYKIDHYNPAVGFSAPVQPPKKNTKDVK